MKSLAVCMKSLGLMIDSLMPTTKALIRDRMRALRVEHDRVSL
jgi:hypothetical protein